MKEQKNKMKKSDLRKMIRREITEIIKTKSAVIDSNKDVIVKGDIVTYGGNDYKVMRTFSDNAMYMITGKSLKTGRKLDIISWKTTKKRHD